MAKFCEGTKLFEIVNEIGYEICNEEVYILKLQFKDS